MALFSQITITLQPGAAAGKDADIRSDNPLTPNGSSPDFIANAWSSGGSFTQRSLIEFDYSSIPANATIISAQLSLFANLTSGHPQHHSSLSGSNECYLKRVVNSWSEASVCWSNQPATSNIHKVLIPQSTNSLQNYPNIDVTDLVQDMFNIPNNNFGFMLMLKTETQYRSMIFASSDHPDNTLHPVLVIVYDTVYTPSNDTCVFIKYDRDLVMDADIRDDFPNTPNGNSPDFIANAWTYGGAPFVERSLIKFQLPGIPQNAIVTSALLTLYANTTSGHSQNHSSLSGANICYLRKITSNWSENSVCWNNQPSYSNTNEVVLQQSISPLEDYVDIDVSSIFQDIVNNPASNYGMMFMLDVEQEFRSMIFASQDHLDSLLWPELTICYKFATGTNSQQVNNTDLFIYPNPSHNEIYLNTTNGNQEIMKIEVISNQGCLVKQFLNCKRTGATNLKFDISDLIPGLYMFKVMFKDQVITKKVIIY